MIKKYFCNNCGGYHKVSELCPKPLHEADPDDLYVAKNANQEVVKEAHWMPYSVAIIIGIAIGVLTHDWFMHPDFDTDTPVVAQNAINYDTEQCRAWCTPDNG